MEEEIKHQTLGDDEFNKSEEEIHRSPRKYIPVPRVKHKTVKQNGKDVHFTVSDDRAYRFETDVENHLAKGNFKDEEYSKELENIFRQVFNSKKSFQITL